MRTLTSQVFILIVYILMGIMKVPITKSKTRNWYVDYLLEGNYDIAKSYVIGDRKTDMVTENLGCQGLWEKKWIKRYLLLLHLGKTFMNS